MNEEHLGSDFDNFLLEEGLPEEVARVAAERILAYPASGTMGEWEHDGDAGH